MAANPKKFTHSMNISLAAPITEGELQAITRAMAKGKALGPDKIVTNFF
jgi:hypothetical protein